METSVLILTFFGGLILLFLLGRLASYIFGLDKYYKDK